jgi:hypothetical protein
MISLYWTSILPKYLTRGQRPQKGLRKGDHIMIQSIQAGSTAFYNSASNVSSIGKVATEETKSTSAAQDENTTVSSQGDTVTISLAGAQAAKTFTGESANRPSTTGVSEDNGYTDSRAKALASAAADAGITEYSAAQNADSLDSAAVSGSSSSSSSDSNLSQYSVAELKEMLQNGEITQAEYDEEIQSREQTDSTDDEDATAVANTSETES